jgi:hypothetical protein
MAKTAKAKRELINELVTGRAPILKIVSAASGGSARYIIF